MSWSNTLRLSGATVALTLIFLAFAASPARAAVLTWDNGSGDSTWSATSGSLNWTGLPWTNGSDALFAGTGVGTVTLGGPITANSVTFNASGYTISGNTLTSNAAPLAVFRTDN